MITLDNITYTYRKAAIPALDDINAEIGSGIHLLLGENGAGKTTLLHIIAGLLRPQAGQCLVAGKDISLREPSSMREIFLLSDNMTLPSRSVNSFISEIQPFYPGLDREFLAAALGKFGLEGNEKFESLSLGNRRKSLIAVALGLGTRTLLLDEPANGLDINSRLTMKELLMQWAAKSPERTAIISTHTVHDIDRIIDGVIMLRRNRLLFYATCEEIASRLQFVNTPVPPAEAIFTMPDGGVFRSIVEADGDFGDIDTALLFTALNSPSSEKILNTLSSLRSK